jgi:hypothetical protein
MWKGKITEMDSGKAVATLDKSRLQSQLTAFDLDLS